MLLLLILLVGPLTLVTSHLNQCSGWLACHSHWLNRLFMVWKNTTLKVQVSLASKVNTHTKNNNVGQRGPQRHLTLIIASKYLSCSHLHISVRQKIVRELLPSAFDKVFDTRRQQIGKKWLTGTREWYNSVKVKTLLENSRATQTCDYKHPPSVKVLSTPETSSASSKCHTWRNR